MQFSYRLGTRHLEVTVRRDAPGRFAVSDARGTHAIDAALLDAQTIQLTVDGRLRLAHVVRIGDARHVWLNGQVYVLAPEAAGSPGHAAALAPPQILAPMPGKVLQVLVAAGQEVAEGDGLVIVEAMKMEHRITAAAAASVRAVHVAAGQMVDGGAVLIELDYARDAR